LNDPSANRCSCGDLHQGNVLRAGREPWLAIDPKGVVGPPVCETGPLLINVLPPPGDLAETRRVLFRRTSQLAEELGIDLQQLRLWGAVRAVLASFWTLEEHGRIGIGACTWLGLRKENNEIVEQTFAILNKRRHERHEDRFGAQLWTMVNHYENFHHAR
jgi:hypothetical protein